MDKFKFFIVMFYVLGSFTLGAQNVIIEGYAYEEGNRGYLNQVVVNIFDHSNNDFITQLSSNKEGFFTVKLPAGRVYRLEGRKDLFEKKITEADSKNAKEGEKIYVKLELKREPGYIFEVTLAPKRESEDIVVPAIKGALIEIYNNTTKEELMVLEDHQHPDFKVHFKKGNHYTILIRKEGYFVKRMEAFVNVEGCILCFEGVGQVTPGVTDNLTNGLEMGTLLANVELVPIYVDKIIELQNITYDFGKSDLTNKGKEELGKLGFIMNDNPNMKVELGSHTDVRGKDSANMTLSVKRAQAAVDYLTKEMKIRKDRIIAVGYGETQIKNKCKWGVECTEEEHAVNRRTEIKILDLGTDGFPNKSLHSMKKEEEFERMILGEGVETVQNKEKSSKIENEAKEVMVSELNTEVEEKKSEEVVSEVMIMKKKEEEKIEEVASEVKTKIEEEKNEEELVLKVKEQKEKREQEEMVKEIRAQEESPIKRDLVKDKDLLEKDNMSKSDLRMQNEKAFLEKRKAEKEAKKLEMENSSNQQNGFSGAKIVIHFSRLPLSEDNEIFRNFKKVEAFETPQKNILYMIGEFETIEQAEKYRIQNLKTSYPNAYVVKFNNGQRIN